MGTYTPRPPGLLNDPAARTLTAGDLEAVFLPSRGMSAPRFATGFCGEYKISKPPWRREARLGFRLLHLRGSLLERTVRHTSGCTICAGGEVGSCLRPPVWFRLCRIRLFPIRAFSSQGGHSVARRVFLREAAGRTLQNLPMWCGRMSY